MEDNTRPSWRHLLKDIHWEGASEIEKTIAATYLLETFQTVQSPDLEERLTLNHRQSLNSARFWIFYLPLFLLARHDRLSRTPCIGTITFLALLGIRGFTNRSLSSLDRCKGLSTHIKPSTCLIFNGALQEDTSRPTVQASSK